MKSSNAFLRFVCVAVVLVSAQSAFAQLPTDQSPNRQSATPLAATAPTAVPALIPYSGYAITSDSKPLSGELGMTFQIFTDETGGEALFTETQMIAIDALGHYTAHLGASSPRGLPAGLFTSGQARWLEVQIAGQGARPRILLASVPYALKAADSATLGGLPASAFVLAGSSSLLPSNVSTAAITPNAVSSVTTTGGTSNKIAKFSGSNTIVSSVIYDNGTNVGIGTTSPASTLTVVGTLSVTGSSTFNGSLSMSALGTAKSSASYPSQQIKIYASAYNSSTKAVVPPHFIWQAEPTGNNTSSPGATLNLLAAAANSASETGFYFNTNGTMHFASGQTFPSGTGSGGGSGTITGVTAGTALTGGGTSGKVTLNVDTSKVPLLASNNTFAGTQTINGDEYLNGGLQMYNSTYDALIQVTSEKDGAWAINAFGGPNGGLAARLFGGYGHDNHVAGSGVLAEGGYTSDDGDGGVEGYFYGGDSSQGVGGQGIYVQGGNHNGSGYQGKAILVEGDIYATGNIIGAAKYFRIDHPLDPANKYLSHASTESSELMNIYSGNVTTDDNGLSTVSLPAWFESINTDFRYQLTVVGQFAQAIIKSKIAGGRFTIMTNAPKVEVLITTVRQDPYAKAHPLAVEEVKPEKERGLYTHPELYGQPKEKQTEWARHSQQRQKMSSAAGPSPLLAGVHKQ